MRRRTDLLIEGIGNLAVDEILATLVELDEIEERGQMDPAGENARMQGISHSHKRSSSEGYQGRLTGSSSYGR